MKREVVSTGLVFLLALIPRPGAAQARAAVEEPVKMDTVLLTGSSPLVSFRILFGVGSAMDPKARRGWQRSRPPSSPVEGLTNSHIARLSRTCIPWPPV